MPLDMAMAIFHVLTRKQQPSVILNEHPNNSTLGSYALTMLPDCFRSGNWSWMASFCSICEHSLLLPLRDPNGSPYGLQIWLWCRGWSPRTLHKHMTTTYTHLICAASCRQGIWLGMMFGTVVQTFVLFLMIYRTNWSKEVSSSTCTP